MSRRLLSAVLLASSLLGCAAGASAVPHRAAAPLEPVAQRSPAPQTARAAVRAELAARREQVVARFLAYREGRVYPAGTASTPGYRHRWIDDAGNLCAAATLISHDWGRAAAIDAVGGNLTIALADVTTGQLADWILTSGLTHHEVVAIQVPGFDPGPAIRLEQPPRMAETERLYGLYVDVERQLRGLWDESLELATDALMARPALARQLLAGNSARPATGRAPIAFAQPPVGR